MRVENMVHKQAELANTCPWQTRNTLPIMGRTKHLDEAPPEEPIQLRLICLLGQFCVKTEQPTEKAPAIQRISARSIPGEAVIFVFIYLFF